MKAISTALLGTPNSRQLGKTVRDNFTDNAGLSQGSILVPFDALEGTLIQETDHLRFYYTHTESDTFHQIAVAKATAIAGPWTNVGSLIGMGLAGTKSRQCANSSCVVKVNDAYYCFAGNGYGFPEPDQDRCLYLYKSADGLTGWNMVGTAPILNLASFPTLTGWGNTSVWPQPVNGKYVMLTEVHNGSYWRMLRAEATAIEGPWAMTHELPSLQPNANGMFGGACHKYLNGLWHCWYHYCGPSGLFSPGDAGPNLPTWLAYATSTDSINWTIKEAPYFRIEAKPFGPIQSVSVGTTQIADPWVEEIVENGVTYVCHTAEYVENSSPSKNQTRWWKWKGTLTEFTAAINKG
jgi:hypothetical protein